MQVHVVGQENAHQYKTELDENFANRHKVFVKKRRWTDLERGDGRDIDAYDTEEAMHFLVMDGPAVLAGFRMHSYHGPNLMQDVFPHLLQRPLPGRPSERIDCTRFYSVARQESGEKRGQLTTLMFAAMMEYGLYEGVDYITFITYAHFIDLMVSLGIRVEPLGGLQKVDRWPSMPAFMHVNEKTLLTLRAALGMDEDVLTSKNGLLPSLRLPALPASYAFSAQHSGVPHAH